MATNHLEIETRRLCTPLLEALYTEHPCPAGLALRDGLSHEDMEALEVEAETYLETSPPRDGRMLCFTPQSYETMSRRRIEALKKTIEDKRPDWVEAIRDAARATNWIYLLIGLSGVPPYPGVAIVENLQARGELEG